MTYHSVLDYIQTGRACGLDDHEIAERLKRGGWLEIDVKDAFELSAKMKEAEKNPAVCPPDHAEHTPTPRVSDRLLSQKTPHLSAMRFTMWFVILAVVFYTGFAFMS